MEPAYKAGEYVLVNRWAYRRRDPVTGDVVVLRDPEGQDRFLIKRIARSRRDGFVVLGDNTDQSRDSRHFGPVPKRFVVGKVTFRARP